MELQTLITIQKGLTDQLSIINKRIEEINSTANTKLFKCDVFNITFTDEEKYNKHLNSKIYCEKIGLKPTKCNKCNRQFYGEEQFKLHETDCRCEKSRTYNGIIFSNMQSKSIYMKKNNIKPKKLIIKTKEQPKEEPKEKKKLIIKTKEEPKRKLIIKPKDDSICKLNPEDFKNSYYYFEAVCKWLNLPVFKYITMSMSYPSIIVPAYKNLDNKIRKHFKIDVNIDVLKGCKIAIHPTFAVNDSTFQYKDFYKSEVEEEHFIITHNGNSYYIPTNIKELYHCSNEMERDLILDSRTPIIL